MPSADFCLLTRHVSKQGAAGLIVRRCQFCVSHRDSYPPDSKQICLVLLINRLNLFRILLMIILPHNKQISPDKNVSFPCTIPKAFGTRTFALRLPSDGRSPSRPCLRLVLLLAFIVMNTYRFSYRGLSPHKLTPMPGVHEPLKPTRNKAGLVCQRVVAGRLTLLLEFKNYNYECIRTIHI